VTAGDWAACALTFGWAASAFWIVHVITRRPSDAPKAPPDDGGPEHFG
jgi:hypothetical protein